MKFLVTIHRPEGYDGQAVEDEAMRKEISDLNREMIAAGARLFVAGLQSPSFSKSLRAQPDGTVLASDGPYLDTKEHIGGFWVLDVVDMDAALEWGRKAVIACRAPVEVRPLFWKDEKPK